MRIGINFQAKDECFSGVEYYSLNLIRALTEHAPEHQYVVFTNRPSVVRQWVSPGGDVEIRPSKYPSWRVGRIAWEHLVLPRLARRERLDVLHCPCYIGPCLGGGVPCVVTIHDTIALDHPRWCTRSNAAYYRLLMKASARRAAKIVAVSRRTGRDIQRRLGVESGRIQVVYPGLEGRFTNQSNPSPGHQAVLRRKYGLPDKFLLHVGNFEPRKNLGCLLRAVQLLRRQDGSCKLVLVGHRHWGTSELLEELSSAGGSEGIVRTGYVDREDLPGIYRLSEAYVCPSLHEGFGFPPLEAMACGVPVIASDRGSLGETLGDAACTIDPMDPLDISDALHRVLADARFREELIRRGLARSRMFRWETAVRQLLMVYAEAAGAGKTG
jgi:glycosyltransferase involved in cell wall biosynthesis